jgi:glycosyltransferase involved in cell wall biosynthesis
MTTVSVIIPCRNYGHFVDDAIKSVLNQTHDDVDLIVVDYGSTDETHDVVARYPQARLIQCSNRGLCIARNFGMQASSGKFLVFLDADDMLTPDAIATSLARLKCRPECAFAYGHESHFNETGLVPDGGLSPGKCLKGDPYAEMLRMNHPLRAPGAMLYRRDLVERIGGFTRGFDGSGDIDLNLRLVREHPIICNDRVVLLTRVHGTNMSRRWAHMLSRTVAAQKVQKRFVAQHPIYRPQYKAGLSLAREYWGSYLENVMVEKAAAKEFQALVSDLAALARYAPGRFLQLPRRFLRLSVRRLTRLRFQPADKSR